MMVDSLFSFFFCSLSLVITSSANIESSIEDGVCIGDNAVFVCSITGPALRWNYEGLAAFFSASSTTPRPLNPFQAEFVSICNGVVMSNATVNVSDSVAITVNGTTFFCDDPSVSTDIPANFTINVIVNEPRNISSINITLTSRYEIELKWEGAQCVSYYVIEVNGKTVITTTETSYIYQRSMNESTFIFTVRGVGYTGIIFTDIFEPFNLRRPACEAQHFLADNNETLNIVITEPESEVASLLPITESYVTFNSVNHKIDRIMSFNVTPGEFYDYIVVIGNDAGSTICGSDSGTVPMNPSPTTMTITERKLPGWAIPVLVVLAFLLSVTLFVIVLLSWMLCSIQNNNNKRVNTTNLRTTSPDEKDMMSSIEKDTSKM